MRYADLIIPRGAYNTVALNLLLENLKTKITPEEAKRPNPPAYVIEPSVSDLPFRERIHCIHKVVHAARH